MNKKFKVALFALIISLGLSFGVEAQVKSVKKPVVITKSAVSTKSASSVNSAEYVLTNPLDIVANPSKYLHKKVKIRAKFDKFSTLGLDYKPAYRSSEKYITFLIKRSDVVNYTIPLSEMKIFMTRKVAEKSIDLDEGDEIEIFGLVFSDALGDAWVEVEGFNVLTAKKKVETSPKK